MDNINIIERHEPLCPSDAFLTENGANISLFTDFTLRKSADIRMFEQDEWVICDDGTSVFINDISVERLVALRNMMERQSAYFYKKWLEYVKVLTRINPDISQIGTLYNINELEKMTSTDWVTSTKLYNGIVDREERKVILSPQFLIDGH